MEVGKGSEGGGCDGAGGGMGVRKVPDGWADRN